MNKPKFKEGDICIWITPDFGDPCKIKEYKNVKVRITSVQSRENGKSWYNIFDYKNMGDYFCAKETSLVLYKPKLKKFLQEYRKEKE